MSAYPSPPAGKMVKKWIDLSVLGLCTVALSGLILRSKIVFALPFINYNHLLEAHSHFTFGGWVTLALMALMVCEVLPAPFNKRPVYQWLLGSIAISAWSMLIAFLLGGYNTLSTLLSTFFILLTYIFGWIFIRDMLKAKVGTPVLLLVISSIACLIISSSGPFVITYIFLTRSFNAILYRDALFTYLHFQYNGFFSLAIFALLFNHISQAITARAKKNIYWFTVVLCVSIIPSLFLSYLWQAPDQLFRIIAMGGSFLVLLSLILFILCARSLQTTYHGERPVIRLMVFLSMGSFMLKSFLQSFTVFPEIGNAIFGNRPIIMGFLHLVFLGFVSLFILAFFAKKGWLDSTRKFTKTALIVFALAIVFNEVLLITQGWATMFLPGSTLFPWLLWAAGICLFAGTVLIAIARIRTRRLS
jgi:hypothetical protein